MLMGPAEAVLQVFSGTVHRHFITFSCSSKSDTIYSSPYHAKCIKKKVSRNMQLLGCSSIQQTCKGTYPFQRTRSGLFHNNRKSSWLQSCWCQQSESASGISTQGVNGTWFIDNAQKFNPIDGVVNGPDVLEFQNVERLKQEREGLTSGGENGTVRDVFREISVNSIEDEAWDLLRESVVYYCGSPIGTIAAKDPTSSNVLNYDQVFIRDFIPSGIAFLLKGEYDIVRNFILHTLQLQVI